MNNVAGNVIDKIKDELLKNHQQENEIKEKIKDMSNDLKHIEHEFKEIIKEHPNGIKGETPQMKAEIKSLKGKIETRTNNINNIKKNTKELIIKILDPSNNKDIDNYYNYIIDVEQELNKDENKDAEKWNIEGENFKDYFDKYYKNVFIEIFNKPNNLSKLAGDSIGEDYTNNLNMFSDLIPSIKTKQTKFVNEDEINKIKEESRKEGKKEGKKEAYAKTYNAAKEIPEIKESVKEIKETINPEPYKDGKLSPLLLLRNNKYLNKIHEYISRGYGDLSREELIKTLKNKSYNDDEAKAYADAILIRKTEQQKRFEPVYKRLRDIRDANLIQRLPEDVQKGINDYEREQYAIKSRDIENYYLLPHEWKRLKAARDYGINPMLLRGIIKE